MTERAIRTRAISSVAVASVARSLPWVIGGLAVAAAFDAADKVPAIITGVVAFCTHWLEWRHATTLGYREWPAWFLLLKLPLAELFWVVAYSITRHTVLNFFVVAFAAYLVVGWLMSFLFAWLIAGSYWNR